MKNFNFSKSCFFILLFSVFILCAAMLKIAGSFFLPITVAVFIAFIFYPFVKFLNKIHIPWVLSVITVVLFAIAIFAVLGNIIGASLRTILNSYPKYEERLTELYMIFVDTFEIPFNHNDSLATNLWSISAIRNTVQTMAVSLSNFMIKSAKTIVTIGLLAVFLLLEMTSFHNKVNVAFSRNQMNNKIIMIVSNIMREVTRYISIKFSVSLFTGILVFLATYVIGMDFCIIWAFLAFILNFIPNFGSIISWILTLVFATLQFYPDWSSIIYVGIVVIAINMILGSIIEPRWEGSDLNISPFIILVGLSFWGWMWGFTGMILSVPIMVIIKIICENIEFLNPIAVLIGGNPKRAAETEKSPENSTENNGELSSEK